ncbi:hypothetical protein WN55_02751 [Dufourea novaeangliae]|uniref:Uncharacterized protein n=1 Tax=Dufourea novaeangliae TaxID=178035 RepID=A0A154NXK1_DUFNO|nr:hypothetical protein WN55_02751 [Dufourea novaeangliae]
MGFRRQKLLRRFAWEQNHGNGTGDEPSSYMYSKGFEEEASNCQAVQLSLRESFCSQRGKLSFDELSVGGDIGESVGSITNSYRTLLKVNKAVVVYCLEAQKRHKKLNIDGIVADLEQSNIAES